MEEFYFTFSFSIGFRNIGKAKWSKSAHGRVLGGSVDEEETRCGIADVLSSDNSSATAIEDSGWSAGYLAKEESS